MNALHRPSGDPQRGGHPHEIDRLLRDFFHAEAPDPWPELKPPTAPARRAGWRSPFRSRLALAASILILLLGQLALSGRLLDYSSANLESGSGTVDTASRRHRLGTPKLVQPVRAPASAARPR